MLCDNCEQRFSRWEGLFAKNWFHPYNSDSKTTVSYGAWGAKFAASVSWRILTHYRKEGLIAEANVEQQGFIDEALQVWREFLLDHKEHVEDFTQHIYPLDFIENMEMSSVSPFLNRFLIRTVQTDVIWNDKMLFTYAKMGKLLLIGVVRSNRKSFGGGKLKMKEGTWGVGDFTVPDSLLQYINDKANETARSIAGMTPNQKQKVMEIQRLGKSSFYKTQVFKAMTYDLKHTGRAAFDITSDVDNSKDE